MTAISEFCECCDAYGAALNLSRARVSTLLLGSGARIDDIEAERRDIGARTIDRAMDAIAQNWPLDHQRPAVLLQHEARRAREREARTPFGSEPTPANDDTPASDTGAVA